MAVKAGKKVKAAVVNKFGTHLDIEELTLERPEQGEVMVKVAFCAICHSDIHSIKGEHFNPPLPAIGGHEVSGYVEEIGEGVSYVTPGDPVIVTIPAVGCGQCYSCMNGQPTLCENRMTKLAGPGRYINKKGQRLTQLGGAMAGFTEYTTVKEYNVVKMPKDMPLDLASLLACGVVSGFYAVINKVQVRPFSSVVVMGTGGVGLNAVQGAVFSGAYPVIAVDVEDNKLEIARKFGATYTINAKREPDPIGAVKILTSGKGADYAFITVAGMGPLRQGFLMCRRGGMTIIIGHAGEQRLSDFDVMEVMGVTLTGCGMGQIRPRIDIPRLVTLYKGGRLKLDELLDRRFSLDQIDEAIESALTGKALRNIIVF
jgi:S-(hydroxymethyl)glutathione dehydrogenase/alcohol dehydrogenase